MPSENTIYLSAIFILFGLVSYIYLKFIDKDDANVISPDYLIGLKYLLDEKSDKAINLFSNIINIDDDTIDTHLALGVLFRRQGNIDKAIKLHEMILKKDQLNEYHYYQTLEELAEDYFAAGIYDKSEDIFLKLKTVKSHEISSLKRLITIYEYTSEWDNALISLEELIDIDPLNESIRMIPHYLCQIADDHLKLDNLKVSMKYIIKAKAQNKNSIRACFLQAIIEVDNKKLITAIEHYENLSKVSNLGHLLLLPKLFKLSKDTNEEDKVTSVIEKLIEDNPIVNESLAYLSIMNLELDQKIITRSFIEYISKQIYYKEILKFNEVSFTATINNQIFISNLRKSLHNATKNNYKYTCSNCGYKTITLSWQCPTCRSWESANPINFIS
ncbi:MAG: tetratricopeptide repeat protein [Pelagibacterales bacterium]|nr:tetratricopeptide repeat protein [Pelagibacterales bacterium]